MRGNGTDNQTIILLVQQIIKRLESNRHIAIIRDQRDSLVEQTATAIRPLVLTHEDMENEVMGNLETKTEELEQLRLSGGEAYRTVRQRWLAKHGEHEVDGLYFQKPIKYIAESIIKFFFSCDLVDEIFAEDNVLLKTIVATIGSFRRSKLKAE